MPEDAYIEVPLILDEEQLFQQFLDVMGVLFPGWDPTAASPEYAIGRTIAAMAAEESAVAAEAAKAIFRRFGQDTAGIPPVEPAHATAPSTWTARDAAGYTIPAGTLLAVRTAGDRQVAFSVVSAVSIPPGSTATGAGEVLLRALEPGADANGLTGTGELIDALAWTDTITLASPSAGGDDGETDDELLDRLSSELRLLGRTIVLPEDFARLALKAPGIERAVAVDNLNANDPAPIFTDTFEADAEGWVGTALALWHTAAGGGVTRSTAAPRTGSGHLLIDVTGGGQGGRSSQFARVGGYVPGDTYRATLWLRLAAGTGDVTVLFGASVGDRASLTVHATAAYQRVDIDWTCSAPGETFAYVAAVPAGATDVYIDDVTIGEPEPGIAGAITVYAVGPGGLPASAPEKAFAQALLESRREANFVVVVADPQYRTIDVAFTAKAQAGHDPAVVQADAESAAAAYLDPAAWGIPGDGRPGWGELTHVRLYEVAAVLSAVPGLSYVETLELNGGSADVLLPRPAGLPNAGTIAGTVT